MIPCRSPFPPLHTGVTPVGHAPSRYLIRLSSPTDPPTHLPYLPPSLPLLPYLTICLYLPSSPFPTYTPELPFLIYLFLPPFTSAYIPSAFSFPCLCLPSSFFSLNYSGSLSYLSSTSYPPALTFTHPSLALPFLFIPNCSFSCPFFSLSSFAILFHFSSFSLTSANIFFLYSCIPVLFIVFFLCFCSLFIACLLPILSPVFRFSLRLFYSPFLSCLFCLAPFPAVLF